MYEVEVKVPADHDAVRDRLAELDADRRGVVEQVDTYYGAPHREFAETDEALRLRRETTDGAASPAEGATCHELTYKGPKVDATSKTRVEHGTGVDDPEALDSLLRALGFEPAATVRKNRDRYRLRGYTVTLDAVEGLGTFVEVEREVPEEAVQSTRDGALELLDALGLDHDEQVRTSYLGLLLGVEEE